MQVTTLKKFRHRHDRGKIVSIGAHLDVDNEYGQYLVNNGLAVNDSKALKEYENKMRQEYEDKKMPVEEESEEQRTQGTTGPAKTSESPEQRTQGYDKGKKPGTPFLKEEKGIKTNPVFAESGNAPPDRDQTNMPSRMPDRQQNLAETRDAPAQPKQAEPPKEGLDMLPEATADDGLDGRFTDIELFGYLMTSHRFAGMDSADF